MGGRGELLYEQAYVLATRVCKEIKHLVGRVAVAGSIRRCKQTVGDIEIVAEAKMLPAFFEDADPVPNLAPLHDKMSEISDDWTGGSRYIKARNIYGEENADLDLFLVYPPAQWGSLLAIRTGPARFSHNMMRRLRLRGYQHKQGHIEVIETGEILSTDTEEEFFKHCGLDYIAPSLRDQYYDRS